ncbi:MAG: hypothetical protein KAV43_02650, partial [Hadesarchaea archaeon]|nr:hypothetical protein [Hadesarchaea archaeon]
MKTLNIRAITDGLTPHEKKVLLTLQQLDGRAGVTDITQRARLDQATVMRAALALTQHGLAEMREEKLSRAALTQEGLEYVREGLPERRMLVALASCGPELVYEVAVRATLKGERVQIALAWLRRKGWAEFQKRKGKTVLTITEQGGAAISQKFADELLLERLASRAHRVDEIPADL